MFFQYGQRLGEPVPAGGRPEPRGGRDRGAHQGRQADHPDPGLGAAAAHPRPERHRQQRAPQLPEARRQQPARHTDEARQQERQRQGGRQDPELSGAARGAASHHRAARGRLPSGARRHQKETQVQVLCDTIDRLRAGTDADPDSE